MNWISVKEKLPNQNQNVLAFGKETDRHSVEDFENGDIREIKTCCYRNNEFRYDDHCCERMLIAVTHWMPLPEFPKE